MLTYDPKKRISAVDALNDAWVKSLTSNVEKKELNPNLFKNLEAFNGERKL
jgi:hypothetical protein